MTLLNMQKMMKQAQKLQADMARVQEELGQKTVEATAGGGMVRVVVNGHFEVQEIKIEKEVVDPDDVEMLQDLIVLAVNDGIRKAQEMAQAEMAQVAGNLQIPGLPGGLF
ncbi:MAG TPA: YbaB/EbfC family nucleoid-associated protein [Firmicutes bacterium]|nr:YbaB/EbfC family nucleoid-associated protein [Bacillota bacterium]